MKHVSGYEPEDWSGYHPGVGSWMWFRCNAQLRGSFLPPALFDRLSKPTSKDGFKYSREYRTRAEALQDLAQAWTALRRGN